MAADGDRTPLQVAHRMREAATGLAKGVTIEALMETLDEGARVIEFLMEEIEASEADF